MPEGPEIRIIAKQLNKHVAGATIKDITIVSGPYKTNTAKQYEQFRKSRKSIIGCEITTVNSKGKFMYWTMKCDGDITKHLGINFGLSGGFRLMANGEQPKSTRIAFNLGTAGMLYYVDQRNFGTLRVMLPDALLTRLSTDLGPDIATKINQEVFDAAFAGAADTEICMALMDQSIMAGIGNYLRAEVLYAAGIKPFAKVKSVDLTLLNNTIYNLTKQIIRVGGSSKYKDIFDKSGRYKFAIYGRTETDDGKKVKTRVIDGRKLYYY